MEKNLFRALLTVGIMFCVLLQAFTRGDYFRLFGTDTLSVSGTISGSQSREIAEL